MNSFFSIKKFLYSLFVIFFLFGFGYRFVVVGQDQLQYNQRFAQVSANFLGAAFDDESNAINMGSITSIIIDDSEETADKQTFLEYNVQAGDSLSSIASQFATTIDSLMAVNNLSSASIRPGQKIYITSVAGFIKQIDEKTNPVIFANQYNLDIDDLLSVNNIKNKLMVINKGEELFIPLTRDEGVARGLIDVSIAGLQQERPKPAAPSSNSSRILVSSTPKPQNTVNNQKVSSPSVSQPRAVATTSNDQHIVSQWAYSSKIRNGFAALNCTRYAAVKSPWAFPYVSDSRQYKTRFGNGRERYTAAKNKGFIVSSTPSIGAIAVVSRAAGGYSSAGHVGIVVDVDRNQKRFMIEDMNYYGLGVVTRRWIYMNDSMTQAVANSQPLVGFIPKQATPQRLLDEVAAQ